jgi:hypothetical protein
LTAGRPVHYAIFWVTLKAKNALATINRTTNVTNLTPAIDYTSSEDFNGMKAFWDLNPELYTIKAQRRGVVGTFASPQYFDPVSGEPIGTPLPVHNIKDVTKNHTVHVPFVL